MRLRDVGLADLDAYVRMRCDPVMMAGLGGPLPREGIEAKVRRDTEQAAAGTEWIKMIIPDEAAPDTVAGSVALWSHDEDGVPLSEIGWMVLPEFQGRGISKQAVRMLLELARADGRWGPVHAFPGVSNGPSNGICRSLRPGGGMSRIEGEIIIARPPPPRCSRRTSAARCASSPMPTAPGCGGRSDVT